MKHRRKLLGLFVGVALAHVGAAAEATLLALNNWRITETDSGFLLAHADKAVAPFELFSDGGTPKLRTCEVAKEDARIALLTYASGSAGTSQIYDVTRVVVIDLPKKKILGIVLKAYTPSGGAPELRQPLWMWSANRLAVVDREYGGTTTVRW